MRNSLIVLVSAILIFVSLSCGSNPAAPSGALFGTASFLPPEEGYSRTYEFGYSNENHTSTGGTVNKRKGTLELKVLHWVSTGDYSAASVVRTFNCTIHSTYSYVQDLGVTDSIGLEPYAETQTLDIMFAGDSIFTWRTARRWSV